MKSHLSPLFLTVSLLASSASAAVIVPNFSFESPDVGTHDGTRKELVFSTNTTTTGVTDWTLSRTAGQTVGGGDVYGVVDPATSDYGSLPLPFPFDGRQLFWANLKNDGTTLASANLDTTVSLGTIQANTIYTLDLGVGDRGTPDWSVLFEMGLLANGVEIGTFTSLNNPTGNTPTAMPTYTFNTQLNPSVVGEDLKIRIRMTNTNTTANILSQAALDNVRLDATVIPEPSAALIGGLGMLALLRRRRS